MKKIAWGVCVAVILFAALVVGYRLFAPVRSAPTTSPVAVNSSADGTEAARQGFLYGRITTVDGAVYEGRLRWGDQEEAFWGHYFNGTKDQNTWAAYVPSERLPKERRPIGVFGFEIAQREREADLTRPFMVRFGDITRIEAGVADVRVTLKSGTVFVLDRLEAGDIDDNVRVWDERRGVVDLDSLRIRTIEFRPPTQPIAGPYPLHGTARTQQGDFTGFLQWNREASVGSDTLDGYTAEGPRSLRFDAITSIARHGDDGSRVTLTDGREIVLSESRDVGRGNRGIYVEDPRYGRVLVSWEAFERVDFSPGGSGPAYRDFPPGSRLTGSVTTRSGRRLAGRLVFDLDESETVETLDAPIRGVDYTIPFGLISSILPSGRVGLHDGEELRLERSGDLGEDNAGMLIFVDGRRNPEYVPWGDVERVDLDRPRITDQ